MSCALRNLLFALFLTGLATFASAQMTNEECLGCHSDPTASKDVGGKTVSVHVDETKFAGSVHASLSCSDCHTNVTGYPHEPPPTKATCDTCHAEAQAAWARSLHGKALAAGDKNSATCLSCHGSPHEILIRTDPRSPAFHLNIPDTCGMCHSQKFVMEQAGLTTQPLFSYKESVHGRAVAKGDPMAADCDDCHGYHEILPPNDAKSSIFKFNIPQTCGKCHTELSKVFMDSVHGKAIARGNGQSPVCTDCHGIHNIKPHIDPTSSVAAQNIARTTCGQCHGNVALSAEYGLSAARVESYEQSYHGLAKRLGSAEAANCASCHGVHNILPDEDPKSTIHKSNLAATCGKCHPGSTEKFAAGRVHLGEGPIARGDRQLGDVVMYWVSLIYILLIVATLGGMALHNFLIWLHKARKVRKDPRRTVVRMNFNQRVQHFFMLASFFALVISGFALAWPNSWFALISGPEGVRRVIHRVAAVIMMVLGLYHIGYMVGTAEGRKGLRDFWFRFKDLRDVIGVIRYNLGWSHEHPKMGRFTYAEKAEYWALIWGTIVMGLTGLMLWFEIQVTTWLNLPRWWVDVATLIHYYEAILATGAIIIWHLYAVIFDPDVYPMNFAWYDGKMTEEQYEHEHGEDWERMKHQPPTDPTKYQ
jgi:cytochrome b subunit of formate dehydrogenase